LTTWDGPHPLRLATTVYEKLQRNRIQLSNINFGWGGNEKLQKLIEGLKKEESKALYEAQKELEKLPIYDRFLSNVKGAGPAGVGRLVGKIAERGIDQFPTVSALWKFCGFAPGCHGRNGGDPNYDHKLKATLLQVLPTNKYKRGMIQSDPKYKQFFEECQEKLKAKGWEKGVYGRALKMTVKEFLKDLWLEWRKLEGLDVTKPYEGRED